MIRPAGVIFDNVVSSAEAIEQLLMSSYDLVITDLGRRNDGSQDAGRDLLRHPVITDGGPPVVVYAGRNAVARRDELMALGAFGVSANRENLYELVYQALGRPAPDRGQDG